MIAVVLLLATLAAARVSRINLTPEGPEVSRIAWGTLHLAELGDADLALERIHACLDLGITTIDLSDAYPPIPTYGPPGYANQLFGQALQKEPGLREKLEIVSKMGIHNDPIPMTDTSREYIYQVVNEYLTDLNTTYLDLLVFHMPDYILEPQEVAEVFTELKNAGTVRYFGVSNFPPSMFDLLQAALPFTLVTNQIEISVYNPRAITNGQIDHLRMKQTSPLAWGPLGGHPLGLNNRLYDPVRDTRRLERIRSTLDLVGRRLGGFSGEQVAVAWLLRHPGQIVPILGSMNITRIQHQADTELLASRFPRNLWWDILWVSSEETVWPLRVASDESTLLEILAPELDH